jgi:hypothetical protein
VSPESATHVAWEHVLDGLEAQLASPTSEPWTEPAGLGPVPRALVGRASRLLAAQRDRETALEDERTRVLAHLAALRTIDAAKAPRPSVYLDVTG